MFSAGEPQKGIGRVSRCKLVDKVAKEVNISAVDFEWGKWWSRWRKSCVSVDGSLDWENVEAELKILSDRCGRGM
jgi:hypothetical protein